MTPTNIEDYHFTPFASLLLDFPMAVAKVVRENIIYYEYKPQRHTLKATIFYHRRPGHKERIDIEFTRTAYSFDSLVSMVKQEYDWANHWYNHLGNPCEVEECIEYNKEFGIPLSTETLD